MALLPRRGFYYDVDLGEEKLTDEDLQRHRSRNARRSVKENLPLKAYRTAPGRGHCS